MRRGVHRYRFRSARCLSQGSSVVQQLGTALASSRAALTRDVSRAFLDLGATPFSINRLRRRLGSRTTAIRPSGNSTSPSCHAIPSGAASGSLIQASFGSSLTIPVHHVPRSRSRKPNSTRRTSTCPRKLSLPAGQPTSELTQHEFEEHPTSYERTTWCPSYFYMVCSSSRT